MQTTTNYGYNVPESGDPADINKISENFTKIDTDLKSVSDAAITGSADLAEKIDEVGVKVDNVGTKVDDVGVKVDNISTSIDTLPEEVQNQLNAFKQTIDELKKNVEDTLADVQETVEKSPAGGVPPSMKSFTASSTEDGIKLSYQCNTAISSSGTLGAKDNYDQYEGITKGVMVRYSNTKYPTTPKEGELAFIDEDIYGELTETGERQTKEKTATIVGLTSNEMYFISAFPYSFYNIYNMASGSDAGAYKKNRTKCQWTGTKGTLTVNVTQDYDYKPLGEYTATMTPTAGGQPITKTQSGAATVVFSGLEAGEYTLSFSEVASFTKPENQSVTVVAGQSQIISAQYLFTPPSLSEATWAEIDSLSSVVSNYWSIGDTKDVEVNGETLTFEIVGFNHDNLSDGSGKAGITFGMKNLMTQKRQMNSSNTNKGSYAGSTMNDYVGTTFYNGLPSDLKSVIKSVKKVTGNSTGSNFWSGTRTDDFKTWLFSENEVLGGISNSVGNEGTKYAKFTGDTKRIKKLSNGSGTANDWWLRSPTIDYGTGFCCISKNGIGATNGSSASIGVCVGFCV